MSQSRTTLRRNTTPFIDTDGSFDLGVYWTICCARCIQSTFVDPRIFLINRYLFKYAAWTAYVM